MISFCIQEAYTYELMHGTFMSSKAKNIQSGFPQNQLNPFTFCTFFCAHGMAANMGKERHQISWSQTENIPTCM